MILRKDMQSFYAYTKSECFFNNSTVSGDINNEICSTISMKRANSSSVKICTDLKHICGVSSFSAAPVHKSAHRCSGAAISDVFEILMPSNLRPHGSAWLRSALIVSFSFVSDKGYIEAIEAFCQL